MNTFQTIVSLLGNVGILDVVDIALVAAMFFAIFVLLRRSRSDLALRSLIWLLSASFVGFFVALILQLSALTLVLSRFWTVVLVIYLIVHQGELRRAVQEIGRIRLVRGLFRPQSDGVSTLARAVMRLSEKTLGALFVIERRDSVIGHLVSPGVEIDALISEELIVTLFFSYNPLHDGAVLITNDRIARAATVLPLSKTADLPKGLGTRHRAAIEITEVCDAITIVVSEESGTVSLVVGGMMDRDLDEAALRKALERLLGVRSSTAEASHA